MSRARYSILMVLEKIQNFKNNSCMKSRNWSWRKIVESSAEILFRVWHVSELEWCE